MFEDLRVLASLHDSTNPTAPQQLLDSRSAFAFGLTWDSSSRGFLHAPDSIWNPAAPAQRNGMTRTIESVYSLDRRDHEHISLDPGYAACVSEDAKNTCWSDAPQLVNTR